MPETTFERTPDEQRGSSIRVVGDTVVLLDPYRWRRVALLLVPIALGAYETVTTENLRWGLVGTTVDRSLPPDRPWLMHTVGVATVIISLLVVVVAFRRRIVLSPGGITVVVVARRLRPWSTVDCVYRRIERGVPSRKFGIPVRGGPDHRLVIESEGQGHPVFITSFDPEQLDRAVEVMWRYRHATFGPWPRVEGGTDPLQLHPVAALVVTALFILQVVAGLLT